MIELWYEPVEELKGKSNFISEMTKKNHAFISGIVRERRPKKIVEIGVAEGGTTAVIMNTLTMLGEVSEVYSVDLCERFYVDASLETGYEYARLSQYIENKNKHRFLLGKTIAGCLEEIGEGIDCVIIDTTHILPGEVLDFLCVLPYLAKNACVILHDVDWYYECIMEGKNSDARETIATRVLASAVSAKWILASEKYEYINIAAFEINEDTYKYADRLFYLLGLVWGYNPGDKVLEEYRNWLCRHYNNFCLSLFDSAVETNAKMRMALKRDIRRQREFRFPFEEIKFGSKIAVYGAGRVGADLMSQLNNIGYCSVTCWVDKAYKEINKWFPEVEKPEVLLEKDFDYICVAVDGEANLGVYNEVVNTIKENGWDRGKTIVGPIMPLEPEKKEN